jgi:hypothetical protein
MTTRLLFEGCAENFWSCRPQSPRGGKINRRRGNGVMTKEAHNDTARSDPTSSSDMD